MYFRAWGVYVWSMAKSKKEEMRRLYRAAMRVLRPVLFEPRSSWSAAQRRAYADRERALRWFEQRRM